MDTRKGSFYRHQGVHDPYSTDNDSNTVIKGISSKSTYNWIFFFIWFGQAISRPLSKVSGDILYKFFES